MAVKLAGDPRERDEDGFTPPLPVQAPPTTAPVEEVERGELAPVEAAPTVTESVTQPESVTETVTEDVAPPTETPPLPTQNYERMFEDMNPALKKYKQDMRAWQAAQDEPEPTVDQDLPDPLKKTIAEAKGAEAREQGSADRLKDEAEAAKRETNIASLPEKKAQEEEGDKLATDTLNYINGIIGSVPSPWGLVGQVLGIYDPKDYQDSEGKYTGAPLEYSKGYVYGGGQMSGGMAASGIAQYAGDLGFSGAQDFLDKFSKQLQEAAKGTTWEPRQPLFPDWRSQTFVKDFADWI
jgi:hypothetical protein